MKRVFLILPLFLLSGAARADLNIYIEGMDGKYDPNFIQAHVTKNSHDPYTKQLAFYYCSVSNRSDCAPIETCGVPLAAIVRAASKADQPVHNREAWDVLLEAVGNETGEPYWELSTGSKSGIHGFNMISQWSVAGIKAHREIKTQIERIKLQLSEILQSNDFDLCS